LNPTLFIIAGPNGSGKSFFSDSYLKQNGFNLTSFDYDLEFEMRWKKFSYDPYIEDGVRSATSEFFEESYELALKAKQDFAYDICRIPFALAEGCGAWLVCFLLFNVFFNGIL
jgi:AAA15 family ATPase/GTPase